MTLRDLIERVSLAMAESEGNGEPQARAIANNHDVLGYRALAVAAVAECRRHVDELAAVTDDEMASQTPTDTTSAEEACT